ncbi:polysaccharide deacetylase [Paenibacillus albidus]|nr:polysaccharide deacetylase [Paenibacillus albidus]
MKKVSLLLIVLFVSLGLVGEAGAAGSAKLKLGVNDTLTEIYAVADNNTYYVPVRDLAKALDLTLTGLADGIQVAGHKHKVKLLNGNAGALLQDGTTVQLKTFQQNGKLMVPLKVTAYLGYTISFKADQYLLRVKDANAALDDSAFVAKYKEELKPKPVVVPTAPTAPGGTEGKKGATVYLTFDDGPTAATSQLLDILAKYDVKATFFMIGPNMNTYKSQVKRIAKEEHGLALHGMTHRKEKFYASPAAALAEMNGDNAILKKITGTSTSIIRTPYGSKPYFTKTFRDKVLGQGYHLWDWNVDSEDWRYKENSTKIYNSVMSQVHKLGKNTDPVILMHDQKATLKVLPRILEALKKEGYQFAVITKDQKPLNFWHDAR